MKATILACAALTAATLISQNAVAGTPLPVGQQSQSQERNWSDIQQVGYQLGSTYGLPAGGTDGAIGHMPLPGYGPTIPNNYPAPKAGLYPSPVQNTPGWHGQTIVTNQAFAPHEMLYPHEYHAMYGPYYYQVRGGFIWTPFGMRTHERWELKGTEVEVKYHDRIKLFSGFHPPR